MAGLAEVAEVAEVAEADPIPARVFEPGGALPWPLQQACAEYDTEAGRDLFLLGWLPVFASASPHVLTRYGRAWKSMCVLSVVVAEAGSGKSAFAKAADAAKPLHDRLIAQYTEAKTEWDALSADDRAGRIEPPATRLLFAADSSMRDIGDALVANAGRGLVFDTEIAELSRTLKSDWGNFTTLLLKSFEQEAYTRGRKGEAFVYIQRPAISVGLTGTPRSFLQLVPDEESGLFSRLLTYTFAGGMEWSDQFGEFEDPLDAVVDRLGADADAVWRQLSARPLDPTRPTEGPRPLYLRLTPGQQTDVNRAMGGLLSDALVGGRVELAANVKRGALQAIRIAGLLALYRLYLSGADLSARIDAVEPTDAEVDAGLDVVHTAVQHAARLSLRWATDPAAKIADEARRALFDALPAEFATADALAIGETLALPVRTVTRALSAFVKLGVAHKVRQGHYAKGAAPGGRITTPAAATPGERPAGDGFHGALPSEGYPLAGPDLF